MLCPDPTRNRTKSSLLRAPEFALVTGHSLWSRCSNRSGVLHVFMFVYGDSNFIKITLGLAIDMLVYLNPILVGFRGQGQRSKFTVADRKMLLF